AVVHVKAEGGLHAVVETVTGDLARVVDASRVLEVPSAVGWDEVVEIVPAALWVEEDGRVLLPARQLAVADEGPVVVDHPSKGVRPVTRVGVEEDDVEESVLVAQGAADHCLERIIGLVAVEEVDLVESHAVPEGGDLVDVAEEVVRRTPLGAAADGNR